MVNWREASGCTASLIVSHSQVLVGTGEIGRDQRRAAGDGRPELEGGHHLLADSAHWVWSRKGLFGNGQRRKRCKGCWQSPRHRTFHFHVLLRHATSEPPKQGALAVTLCHSARPNHPATRTVLQGGVYCCCLLVQPVVAVRGPAGQLLGLEPQSDLTLRAGHRVRAVADVPPHLPQPTKAHRTETQASDGPCMTEHSATLQTPTPSTEYHLH